MPSDNVKSYLHLHLIVFIWGFTAILGKLISLEALDLVWYRMLFASLFILIYIIFNKQSLKISIKTFFGFSFAGIIIAAHWFTFYEAIKVSNISITLACLSTGAFFASILEPILYQQKINWSNVLLGLLVIVGLYFIAFATIIETHGFLKSFQNIIENKSVPFKGIILAIISAFLSALFSVINGKFAREYNPTLISIYELGFGIIAISIFMWSVNKFEASFFQITTTDFLWLLVLSSICTAYAFLASVKVMKVLSPFTVMLTINLEPVYGILLAYFLFTDTERMSPLFYLGASFILVSVLVNGILKLKSNRK